MSIAIDWIASTTSERWQQANKVNLKKTGISFFDYLYMNRQDIHKAMNVVLAIFGTLAFLTLAITLISYAPSLSNTLFFTGLPIGGPCCLAAIAIIMAVPLYVKHRLNVVEKSQALYYLSLDIINIHMDVKKYKNDPS